MIKITKRPDSAPNEAQALVRFGFAKCWMWFDEYGPVVAEISWWNRILLLISTVLHSSNGFSVEIIEQYDETFEDELGSFEKYS